jgi:1-acyl-sn-glycerol-3-phosphate acyltransferase
MSNQHRFLWNVSPPIIRGLGRAFFGLEVDQEAELPPPPFVFAANHYSHFDSPVIGSVLDLRVRFLALEDLLGVSRFLDWLVGGYGIIPTPRDRWPVRAVRTALGALEAGEVVGLFPEATRVSHWGTLAPKRGAAWLSLKAGVPLVPVAAIGTGKTFGLENKLHRAPIRIVIGEALPPEGNPDSLTQKWADWMTAQIEKYPDSEVSGPRRAFHGGL